MGALCYGFQDDWYEKVLQEPVRLVEDEVISCPREGDRMKAYRTLVDQGLAKLLQGMEDPLAAYVSTRMMMRVESETFTTMVAERDRAVWEASQCKVNPLREPMRHGNSSRAMREREPRSHLAYASCGGPRR